MEHVADLEAPARVHRLARGPGSGGNLLGSITDDLVVPAHEELGVLRLLHQEVDR